MAAEGQHSIFHQPVNSVWDRLASVTGLEERLGTTDVPDYLVMSLFVVALIAVVVIPLRFRLTKRDPGWLQQLLEVVVQGLCNLADDIIGEGAARRYLPLIGSFAVFIFLCNLTGQFFFLQPPTQSAQVTFALAITAWVFYQLMGLKAHGLGYFKQFLGPGPPPWWLWPLMVPLEIVSHTARILSLGIRLFGNIFGEHVAVGVFFALVPFLLPLPLMALGLFAAFIQTFIFVILTTVYIAGAEASH
jgi:F-type H+-transporting ATPase subunit a